MGLSDDKERQHILGRIESSLQEKDALSLGSWKEFDAIRAQDL